MEKESQLKLLVFLVCLVALLSVITMFIAARNNVDEQKLADKVTAQVLSKIDIPTAAEIAADVKVNVTVPEVKAIDNSKVNDLWENLYSTEIEQLENESYNVAIAKLLNHNKKVLNQWFETNVVGFDEITDVDNYEFSDCDLKVIDLGLKEDEDKVATVNCDLKVEYTLKEGESDDFKKTVNMEATVTFDEGDFGDEDVELVFA